MDRSCKQGRMATEVARNLARNWVWLPPEVLPPIKALEDMNLLRYGERGVFWRKVLEGAGSYTEDRNKNLPIVKDVLLHLSFYQLPEVETEELISGIAFGTVWYREHKRLAYSFFQVLQNWRVERRALTWEWRNVRVGNASTMKVFVVK